MFQRERTYVSDRWVSRSTRTRSPRSIPRWRSDRPLRTDSDRRTDTGSRKIPSGTTLEVRGREPGKKKKKTLPQVVHILHKHCVQRYFVFVMLKHVFFILTLIYWNLRPDKMLVVTVLKLICTHRGKIDTL